MSAPTLNQIITGDALTELCKLPSNYVQTCITSPPYYGLRDYGVPGQIGLEDTPAEYIEKLVAVFREVRRVLRDDGTLWLNIGDSYAGSWGNYAPGGIKGTQRPQSAEGERWERKAYQDTTFLPPTARAREMGYKPKDLMMMPARLALALQADGWWLRSDIIWSKPNAMPESVEDRPTKSHEYIFLLSKSERYYYDADAIREPHNPTSLERWRPGTPRIASEGSKNAEFHLSSFGRTRVDAKSGDLLHPSGRNKRTVWVVTSQPYSEAHFATFPPKLIEPCILAGTSLRACEHCGAPWERVTEVTGGTWEERKAAGVPMRYGLNSSKGTPVNTMGITQTHTIGWQPTCQCDNEGIGKCVVLDCFMGAGTTALVAIKHHRNYLGIELNPSYVQLIEKRIAAVQQTLWESEGVA